MSMSSIRTLGISSECSDWGYQVKQSSRSPLRVHGRVIVSDDDGPFDVVRISLKGAIETRIGGKTAVEKLPSSTLLKEHVDFQPAYSTCRRPVEEKYLDFVLHLPDSQTRSIDALDASARSFVPSLSLTASTYITKVTALKDRHLLEGSCQVMYWLEAKMIDSSTGQVRRKLSCAVDVSSQDVPLDVEVLNREDLMRHVIKPSTSVLGKVFAPAPQPRLTINMPAYLGTISSGSPKSAIQSRHLSIPVCVSLDTPSQAGSPDLDTLKCSVKANWYTSRTISLAPLSQTTEPTGTSESRVRSTAVSSQKLDLTLPPFFDFATGDNDGPSSYSTSTTLDLTLPDSVSCPSVSTSLLNITYVLELSMKFLLGSTQKHGSVRNYNAHFHLPLTLSAAQPGSTLDIQRLEPLSGLVEEGLIVAPPPYVS